MTGFGRGEATAGEWMIDVELSGVNRKQVEVSVNLPGSLAELTEEVRRLVSSSVSRGRITAKVVLAHGDAAGENGLAVDEALARKYVEAARDLSEKTGVEMRLTAADLFRAPGLFQLRETAPDPENLREPLAEAVTRALEQLRAMQVQEGDHLRTDLLARLDGILAETAAIRERAPDVPEAHRRHLAQRLENTGLEIDLDDERLLREIALFAERCDITEELTRLESHAEQFRSYLDSDEPAGRPLDFLCQEFNRELNTIGSKANDAGIAQGIVNAKTELEKIREQVQNVQ